MCIAAAEPASGLRDTVPVGSSLPMKAGSAAQVLLAWQEPAVVQQALKGARFSAAALAGPQQRLGSKRWPARAWRRERQRPSRWGSGCRGHQHQRAHRASQPRTRCAGTVPLSRKRRTRSVNRSEWEQSSSRAKSALGCPTLVFASAQVRRTFARQHLGAILSGFSVESLRPRAAVRNHRREQLSIL